MNHCCIIQPIGNNIFLLLLRLDSDLEVLTNDLGMLFCGFILYLVWRFIGFFGSFLENDYPLWRSLLKFSYFRYFWLFRFNIHKLIYEFSIIFGLYQFIHSLWYLIPIRFFSNVLILQIKIASVLQHQPLEFFITSIFS